MKIKGIKMYATETGVVRFRVTIDEAISGIIVVNGNYVDGEVTHVDFTPKYFLGIVLSQLDALAYKYEKQNEKAALDSNASRFGAAELSLYLRDAEIEMVRTRFEPGDEYVDADGVVQTHDYVGYNTEIISVKPSDKIQKMLDKMLEKLFDI